MPRNTKREKWLEDAIYDYIKNKSPDSVDIVNHFKLRADITMRSVGHLQEDNKIDRIWNGIKYYYEVKKNMKIKKIIVTDCSRCPNMKTTSNIRGNFCKLKKDFMGDKFEIPVWCPLPDEIL